MKFLTNRRGFTLAEVAIAISMLGLGLTTLIVLQTRYTDNYIYERNLTKAALAAQYMMTMIEVKNEVPELGVTEKALATSLDEHGYFNSLKAGVDEKEKFKGWSLSTEVSSVELYEFEDAIRRIDLTVSWSDSARDQFNLFYFVLNTEGLDELQNSLPQ